MQSVFFAVFSCKVNLLIRLRIHSRTLFSRTCSENLFFYKLPANQGKMTNQLRQQLRETCWRGRKIFPRTWKRTKILTNTVFTERRTSFVFNEKNSSTNCSRTLLVTRTSCLRTGLQIYVRKCICSFKPRIHKSNEWFANRSQTVCEPNALMFGRDCEPTLRHPQTVRIPFARKLLVFCANTKRIGCPGCPLLASCSQKIN